MSNGSTPPGFPGDIPVVQEQYQNWARGITVPNVWTCTPQNANDVVRVCNWATGAKFTVRPRGIMHGWSPLTVTNGESTANVMLVDLTQHVNQVLQITPASGSQPARVQVQTGMTMEDLMSKLQAASGGSTTTPGTGFGFAHIPAPGHLTVGGVLAINAHGTAVPGSPNDTLNISYGSLSNQILAFTAVVSEPSGTYVAQSFSRTDADALAFLAHCGRAFLLDVTLQVTNNYNLRCQSMMNIDSSVLFAKQTGSTPPPQSCGDFLAQSGRIEIIWFPTFPTITWKTYPWLKVWSVSPQKPSGSRTVNSPYNYPFSDNLPPSATDAVDLMVETASELTPHFTATSAIFTAFALNPFKTSSVLSGQDTPANALAAANATALGSFAESQAPGITEQVSKLVSAVPALGAYFSALAAYAWDPFNLTDLWGASMNTLLYVKDTTLLVTANGYAIQMKKEDVQNAIADFTEKFSSMLADYQSRQLYPINSPMEIRVTALDEFPPGDSTLSPTISALSYDEIAQRNGWDVAVWFDVLTVQPEGDPQQANRFYADLEQWIGERFGSGYRVNPEWSKGWAYTADQGAWTSAAYLEKIRLNFTTGRSSNTWADEVTTLQKYDSGNLFWNEFLHELFVEP
jgi:hypothetical protein